MEQAGFRDYAEKLSAPMLETEDKNANMISDKFLSNAANLQESNQAHSSQVVLSPNIPNSMANVDSGQNEKLLRAANKKKLSYGIIFWNI